MIKFAKPEKALKPKKQYIESFAYVQAVILITLAFLQLFNLQDFLNILQGLGLGDRSQIYLLGCFIVWAEIFSLPFLLRMKLSKAFRVFSMLLLWAVTIFWLYLSVWLSGTYENPVETGLLGGFISIKSGIELFIFSVLLGGLSINNIWGLWPIKPSKKFKLFGNN